MDKIIKKYADLANYKLSENQMRIILKAVNELSVNTKSNKTDCAHLFGKALYVHTTKRNPCLLLGA